MINMIKNYLDVLSTLVECSEAEQCRAKAKSYIDDLTLKAPTSDAFLGIDQFLADVASELVGSLTLESREREAVSEV